MPPGSELTVGGWIATLQAQVEIAPGPICVHDICRLGDMNPKEPGAAHVVLAFVDRLRRKRWGAPPSIGGAGVGIPTGGWLSDPLCDYFYWSLRSGAPSTPDGLARFGVEWQGAMLAQKVRSHAESFPRIRPGRGRGPPMPDILLRDGG